MRLSSLFGAALLGAALFASSANAQATTGKVTVIHGIPGLPQAVDVFANNSKLFSFKYGEQQGPLSLQPATYNLEVRLGNTPVLKTSAKIEAGKDYTVIAHLDANGNNKLSAFVNDTAALKMDMSRLVVRHTAQAPAVDVVLAAQNHTVGRFNGLTNPNEAKAEFRAGDYSADIFVANTTTKAFGPIPLKFEPGYSYIAYAVGEALKPSFQVLVQRIAISTGNVTVLHGIPGLPQDVSVFANNAKLFDFGYGEQRGPLALPAGSYKLEVRLGTTPVLNATAEVKPQMDYSVIAHLDANGSNKLSLFANDISKTGNGNARVTVRHTAQAPAVDVQVLRNNSEIAKLRNLSNPNEVIAELPEGSYEANIFVANTTTKAFGPAQLPLMRSKNYVVYAVGEALKPSFRLLIQAIDVEERSGLKSSITGMSCGGNIWISTPSPRFGSDFDVELFGAEGLTPALLNLGFDNTAFGSLKLPLSLGALGAPGCTIYNDIVVLMGTTTDLNGNAKMSVNIPAFIERDLKPVYFQWWYPVAGNNANALGFRFSEQLTVEKR